MRQLDERNEPLAEFMKERCLSLRLCSQLGDSSRETCQIPSAGKEIACSSLVTDAQMLTFSVVTHLAMPAPTPLRYDFLGSGNLKAVPLLLVTEVDVEEVALGSRAAGRLVWRGFVAVCFEAAAKGDRLLAIV